jgi:sugar/nucleoside kinase (ribokinase family)
MLPQPGPVEEPAPDIVVVGAASRDLAADDARGWRLGGAATYAALATARLGVRTGALVGLDADATGAHELGALREAGVALVEVRLPGGPVFDNVEGPAGRRQVAHAVGPAVPTDALPASWRAAGAWFLGPVAGELEDAWAAVPSDASIVALGWQGLLRDVRAGEVVRRVQPARSALLARADIVGVSRDDLDPETTLADLCALLRPGATLIVTAGADGGVVAEAGSDGPRALYRYPAFASDRVVDPTGAGDVFLAAVLAARARPQLIGGRLGQRFDLRLAAAVASLVVEAPGLGGVPTREAVRRRMADAAGRVRPAAP